MRELHALSIFVHGTLAGLHLLGATYNARKRNWWDVAAHSLCVVYDVHAVVRHMRSLRCPDA